MGVRSESLRKGWTTASAHSPLQLEGGDKITYLRGMWRGLQRQMGGGGESLVEVKISAHTRQDQKERNWTFEDHLKHV